MNYLSKLIAFGRERFLRNWKAERAWQDPQHPMWEILARAGFAQGALSSDPIATLDGMSQEEAVYTYAVLALGRAFSERSYTLKHSGQLRFAICGFGHEGFQAALATLLENYAEPGKESARDEIAAYYRGQTYMFARGLSVREMMELTFALPTDLAGGTQMPVMWGKQDAGVMPVTADVSSHFPGAVGRAKSKVLLHEPGVVITTTGDGGTRAAPFTSSLPESLARRLPMKLWMAMTRAGAPEIPTQLRNVLFDMERDVRDFPDHIAFPDVDSFCTSIIVDRVREVEVRPEWGWLVTEIANCLEKDLQFVRTSEGKIDHKILGAVMKRVRERLDVHQHRLLGVDSVVFQTTRQEVVDALRTEIPEQFAEKREAAIAAVLASTTPNEFRAVAQPMIHRAFPAQAPVIFVVEDNEKGISTAAHEVLPGGLPPEDGPDGILFLKVDGADVVASRKAWRTALEHTRARRGPVMIWADVPRLEAHSTTDQQELYLPVGDIVRTHERDPLHKWRSRLLDENIVEVKVLDAIDGAIDHILREEAERCKSAKRRDPDGDPEGAWGELEAHHYPSVIYTPRPETLERPRLQGRSGDPTSIMSGTQRVYEEMMEEAWRNGGPLYPLFFGEDVDDGIRGYLGERHVNARPAGRGACLYGGVFRMTQGVGVASPEGFVFNSGIAEDQIVGAAVGYALSGKLLPVAEIQFTDYRTSGFQQMVDILATMAGRTGGRTRLPLMLRMQSGAYLTGAAGYGHGENAVGTFLHYPGWYVAMPSTPWDAVGMTRHIFRMQQAGHWMPVVWLEPKASRYLEAPFYPTDYEVPVGRARVAAEGNDITLISYGNTFHLMRVVKALLEQDDVRLEYLRKSGSKYIPHFVWYGIERARKMVSGMPKVSAGLVDLRWLAPFDTETCLEQLRRTNGCALVGDEDREMGGAAMSIAQRLSQEYFRRTGEPSFVWARGARHSRVPYGSSEEAVVPQVSDFLQAALELLNR